MGAEYKRHVFLYRLLWFPVTLFVRMRLKFSAKAAPQVEGTYLVLSNHNTNWDPMLVACSFKKHMYFVSSEHLYRRGFASTLLKWALAPIAKIKGSTDIVSATNIIRSIKQGANVCLFAEGNRSWNGLTSTIHPTTARLVKACRTTLITYKLSGGYFTSPRWSISLRRGKMQGQSVNVYTPEKVQSMTIEELAAAIEADLYEDAYAAQRDNQVPYYGKNLAMQLESALYVCPHCKGINTLKSEDNRFFCSCGLALQYNVFGFFEGSSVPFETVTQWDLWQESYLKMLIKEIDDGAIFSDENQSLWSISHDHEEELVAAGTLSLFENRLVLGTFVLPLNELSQMSIYGRETIVFSANGVNYEIKSDHSRSGRKYVTLFDLLSQEINDYKNEKILSRR